MPIPDKKEVHTPIILHKLKVYHPNLTFVLPRVEGQSLVSHLWEPSHTLLASSFGVPEPPPLPETVVHPAMLDVIVVPLLAHDQGGHRVGYGAGYYDRFLALCRPDAITVGLSFFPPVEVITDLHPNDVPLKLCIVA
jgi:5-formyltetrahydrofolate cyclo-ligase